MATEKPLVHYPKGDNVNGNDDNDDQQQYVTTNPNDIWLGLAESSRSSQDTHQQLSEKRITVHITLCAIVVQCLTFIGWLNPPVSVAFIAPALIGLAFGLTRLYVYKDYAMLRWVNLTSGLLYAIIHFIAEGCRLMERSGARYLLALSPSLIFHPFMGGDVKNQIGASIIHLVLYIIFAIVEGATSTHCYETIFDPLVYDAPALTFVYAVLPFAVIIFGMILIFSAYRIRTSSWAFTERMAADLARYLREHNFAGARSYVAQATSGRDAQMSLADLVMCAGVTHAAMFEEISLIPVQTTQHHTPSSHQTRSGSYVSPHGHLTPSPSGAEGGGGMMLSVTPAQGSAEGPGSVSDVGAVKELRKTLSQFSAFGGDGGGGDDGGSGTGLNQRRGRSNVGIISPDTMSETGAGGQQTSPQLSGNLLLSPSKVAGILDGATAGRDQHGGMKRRSSAGNAALLRSNSTRSRSQMMTRGGSSVNLTGGGGDRRQSVSGASLLSGGSINQLTVTPGFLLLISLPMFPAYVRRQQSAEMLKLLLGEYFDAINNICNYYDGKVVFCCFTDVFCLFDQCASACAASLAIRSILEKDSSHHRDMPFLELQPTRSLSVVFHTTVVSSIVGTVRSVKLGSCDGQALCEVVKSRVIRSTSQSTALPILLLASKLLPLVSKDLEHAKVHDIPKFVRIVGTKLQDNLGYPKLSSDEPAPLKAHDLEPPLVTELLADDPSLSSAASTATATGGGTSEFAKQIESDASSIAANLVGSGGPGSPTGAEREQRSRLSPEIAEIWRQYDADRSGTLELNEMRELLLDIGIEMTDDELQKFFDEVDYDKSGNVSQEEFAKAFERPQLAGYQMILELKKKAQQMRIQNGMDNLPIVLAAWKRYDMDGNGVLDASEVAKVLQDLGIQFPSPEHVEWFIERFDQNGSGTIELDEFASLFSEATGNTQLNLAKARIETVSRVLSNKHGNMTYSTPSQDEHDALIRFHEFWKNYMTLPLFLYILYNFGNIGYHIGLGEDSTTAQLVLDMVTDVLYYVWFGLKLFYLPRMRRGQFILEREEILEDYLHSTEFYFDLVVVIPFDIAYLANPNTGDRGIHSYYRIGKLLSMFHINELMNQLFLDFAPSNQSILTSLMWYFYTSHVFACVFLIIARIYGDDYTAELSGWDKTTEDRSTSYLQAILWALLTLAGQVKGNPVPSTNVHLVLLYISVFIGIPLFGILLGVIGNAVTTDNGDSRFRRTIDALKGYFQYTELPAHLEIACIDYYRHIFITTGSLEVGTNPLEDLPVELSVDVTIAIGSGMLSKVPIFADASENVEFVHELTSKMTTRIIEPGLRIMKKGERGSNMYFITYGQFHIVNDEGVQVWTLRKGNFFGEIALLQNVKRTATIYNDKARFANVLVLEKRDFDQVASIFPECVSMIFQKAESRLKELREKEAQEAKEHKEKEKAEKKKKKAEAKQAAASSTTAAAAATEGGEGEKKEEDKKDDDKKDDEKK